MFASVVVSSEDEIREAVEAASRENLRIAAVSNAGLPAGRARLTFLPDEAFSGPPSTLEETVASLFSALEPSFKEG